PNLYPQDRLLNWAAGHSYSAGVVKRLAAAAAVVPFEQAAAQVRAAGASRGGQRQGGGVGGGGAGGLAGVCARRPPAPGAGGGRVPDGVGLRITAAGPPSSVRPAALRPATAKAAAARQAASAGWPEDPGQLRKSKKRSAELVCVADIPPAPRSSQDILDALFA